MNEKIKKFENNILKMPGYTIFKIKGNLKSKFKNKISTYKHPDFLSFSKSKEEFKKKFNEGLNNKNIVFNNNKKVYKNKVDDNIIPSSTIKGLFHCFYYHNKGKYENELFGSKWDEKTKNHVNSEKKGCLIFFDGFTDIKLQNKTEESVTFFYFACKNQDIDLEIIKDFQKNIISFYKSNNIFIHNNTNVAFKNPLHMKVRLTDKNLYSIKLVTLRIKNEICT